MNQPPDESKPGRFEIEHDVSKEIEHRTPVARAKSAPRSKRDEKQPTEAAVAVIPWPLRPGLLLLLGAALLTLAWIGYHNPEKGVLGDMPYWPWQLFRADLDQGGDAVFLWDRYRAVALGCAALILFLVVAAVLKPSRGRGVAVMVAAALGATLFWWDSGYFADTPELVAAAVAALAAGTVVLRDLAGSRRARKGLLFVLTLLLAGITFFPRFVHTLGDAPPTYEARALDFARPLGEAIEATRPLGLDRIWSTDGLHAIGLVLIVGLLLLLLLLPLRLGRSTRVRLMVVAVLFTALAPWVGHLVLGASLSDAPVTDLLRSVGEPRWNAWAGVLLILLASLLSLLGMGGRVTVGAAGVGLGLLALVVTSRMWMAGFASAEGHPPFYAGLARAALWLGPALGAFVTPLAAAVLDQGARLAAPSRK